MDFSNSVNLFIVLKVLSRNLLIISAALILCASVALLYHEDANPFLLASGIAMLTGGGFYLITSKRKGEYVQKKEAYLSVTLSWVLLGLFGSLPYLFSGSIPSFTDAIFESVSGFTTTGSSILADIESLPKAILFWRSLTHWIGGIGIIVLFIIIMPAFQMGGYQMFTMESSLQEKIQPKIRSVGTRLLIIYIALTFSEVLFLLFGGMNIFESVCHAFGTIATGGFSPKNSSIGGYSPFIQYVIMIFMLLSGTNFIIHYYLVKRNFRKVRENDELKYYLAFIGSIGLIITGILFFGLNKSFGESFRESFFQVISIVTCTGYATADYMQWPQVAWIIILFSMFLGGSTGSTAGGIKIARHVVLIRNIRKVFSQLANPNAILSVKLNNRTIPDETNNSIIGFIYLYIIIFIAGSLLLAITGLDGITAASSVATCMAGIGPGIGSVGPAGNFAHIPDAAKWILSLVMIMGRLEIFTILMLFTREYWRS
ncbi:MAG: TrkH family potassium uptake protein [Bacteroidales bacterium]|nr:TrkH family potassium uptake protein [Bacteroidales bacterium]